jgi:hypothetical protein
MYPLIALACISIFASVHLCAEKIRTWSYSSQARFLSAGGGVAIAYIFIDLLPKIGESDELIRQWASGMFPYFERHAYLMALAGFLLFFTVDRVPEYVKEGTAQWLSLGSYALFNFLVGYSVMDKENPEIQPLALFTFAMALHYFTNDYALSKKQGIQYGLFERWILISCLTGGWLTGFMFVLPPVGVALISAFIGGGVIMNVIRHELPTDNPNSIGFFLVSAFLYACLLLLIGNNHP